VPEPNAVHVVFRETGALGAGEIAAAVALLSDDERARCRRFRFADAARDYAAAHALLRVMLSRGTDRPPRSWRFDRTAAGKPFIAGVDAERASFSLTHTRGMVVCAVAAGATVGVDVERVDRTVDVSAISARYFANAEAVALAHVDERLRRARFFDLWTLKEASVKALGLTLAPWLKAFVFQIDEGPAGREIRFTAPPETDVARWQFALFTPAAGYRAAVAARREDRSPPAITIRCAADEGVSPPPAD
jgi:4'-phosphopantetheinyl transferase